MVMVSIATKNNKTGLEASGLKHHIISAPPIPYMRINGSPQITGIPLILDIKRIPLSVISPNAIIT